MKTIVFAASKGGVGKTTLAFNVGVEAAKTGTVFLADLDPQKSLDGLCERRGQQPGLSPDNPMHLDDVGAVGVAVASLNRTGYARDYLIVDTPGSFVEIYEEAIRAADCIVLPVMPSPLDIIAQEDVARLVDKLDKTDKALFVVNRIGARSSLGAEAFERVKGLTPNTPVRVADRIEYVRAMIGGRSGAEMNPDAHKEIAVLWRAIQTILRKGDQHAKGREQDEPVRRGGRRIYTRRAEGVGGPSPGRQQED